VCENCIAEQQKILHQRNILHVKLLDQAFDACIDVGNWQRAVEIGTMLAELLQYSIFVHIPKFSHTFALSELKLLNTRLSLLFMGVYIYTTHPTLLCNSISGQLLIHRHCISASYIVKITGFHSSL